MSSKVIKSSGELLDYVDSLIESSTKRSLTELGMFLEDEDNQVNASSDNIFDDGKGGQQQKSSGNQDAPAPEHGQDNLEAPTADMVVDKLNSIRSGHSFRDTSVKGAMKEYFEKLSDEEKVALLTFLKGIAQIVTGEFTGQQAVEPEHSPSPGIKMSKGGEASGKQVKNVTVVKSPKKSTGSPGGAAPSKGQENTAPPTPVTPRRR